MITIIPFLQRVDRVILNPLLEVLFAVALIYFVWSIIKLVNADGSDKAEARSAVLWSLVGMFVMISVYGIIGLILGTFQIGPVNGVDPTSYIQGKLK